MGAITYDVRVDWNNDGDFSDTGEDITTRVLDRGSIKIQYGRDQARSLSPIAPGQAAFQVDNSSKDYSPDNASSPLFGSLLPGRPMRLQATHNAVTYTLFRGSIDGYDIDPKLAERSVTFTGLDSLGDLATIIISTGLYQTIRTGDAIRAILDAIGWTAGRDIDLGATVLPWWWAENKNALDALKELLAAEGPSSIAYIGPSGEFIFRDREHRLIRTASKSVQATFDSVSEPAIDTEITYDVGWRDILNYVTCDVNELIIDVGLSTVYEDKAIRQIAAGETVTIRAKGSVFIDAVTPASGTDYIVRSGSVSVALSRTSGESAEIRVTASTAAQVEGMKLRAYKLVTLRTVKVESRDQESIAKYKQRSMNYSAPFIGINDAQAILDKIIATHKDRLPIVTIRLVNANDTRIVQMLDRDLSDRIHITMPEANVDADFYIERIEHEINAGKHTTSFGCEKVLTDISGTFVLDVSLLDTGKIGRVGFVNPTELFILDDASQGLIGTNLLGY